MAFQIIRQSVQPQAVTAEFLNCEPEAHYKLVVVNGKPDGSGRASGSVLVNGRAVVKPQDLGQRVGRVEKPFWPVLAKNELAIQLTSVPGSVLTVSVECVSDCLDVALESPTAAGITVTIGRSRSDLFGTVHSSADEVGVTVNGVPAFVAGNRFVVPAFPF